MAKGVKNKKVEAVEAKAVLDTVKDLELTSVVAEIGSLQVSVQGTLANLTATITNKLQQVDQLDTAIGLKESRLQELYGIEKEAVSLDDMKAQKEEADRVWLKERDQRDAEWTEEEAERQKLWARAEEDHKYKTALLHKKIQDEFEANNNKRARDEQIRIETLERTWRDREDALKGKEQLFVDLKSQVDGFDQRLKADVAKAEAVVSNSMKRHYEHEMALLKKDFDSEKNLHIANMSAVNSQMESQDRQIVELQKQLALARADAKDVATQALQSASGRQVADALQSVVNTRSNDNPSKTK